MTKTFTPVEIDIIRNLVAEMSESTVIASQCGVSVDLIGYAHFAFLALLIEKSENKELAEKETVAWIREMRNLIGPMGILEMWQTRGYHAH